MQREQFLLTQLKRDSKIYTVCLKIFLVFMAIFALAFIGVLIAGLGIEVSIFDGFLFVLIAIEYPIIKQLKGKADYASTEIEKALATPGFQIPDDYSDKTKKIRDKIQQDPQKILISAILIAVLALTCFGESAMLIWACSLSGFEDFNAWYAFAIGIFALIGLMLLFLTLRYLKDYKTAKQLQIH